MKFFGWKIIEIATQLKFALYTTRWREKKLLIKQVFKLQFLKFVPDTSIRVLEAVLQI